MFERFLAAPHEHLVFTDDDLLDDELQIGPAELRVLAPQPVSNQAREPGEEIVGHVPTGLDELFLEAADLNGNRGKPSIEALDHLHELRVVWLQSPGRNELDDPALLPFTLRLLGLPGLEPPAALVHSFVGSTEDCSD